MLVAFPALLFVARPPFRCALPGYGLTISFGQFAFVLRYRPGHAGGAGWRAAGRQAFYHQFLAPCVFGERLQGKQLAGIALAIFGVLVCWWRGARRGACPTGGLFMLTLAAAVSAGLRQYFQQKSCPVATRLPIISLVVWGAH